MFKYTQKCYTICVQNYSTSAQSNALFYTRKEGCQEEIWEVCLIIWRFKIKEEGDEQKTLRLIKDLFCQRVISAMTCHCILRQNGKINCHKIFKGVVVTLYHIQNDVFRISSILRIEVCSTYIMYLYIGWWRFLNTISCFIFKRSGFPFQIDCYYYNINTIYGWHGTRGACNMRFNDSFLFCTEIYLIRYKTSKKTIPNASATVIMSNIHSIIEDKCRIRGSKL